MDINKVKHIHNLDLYGIFIEAGCASVVSSALQLVAGASKTVYMSEAPYSKEYQHLVYGKTERSISSEATVSFINTWLTEIEKGLHKGVNFIYASSFQVGENNDISTHGWITVCDIRKKKARSYHISFQDAVTRYQYIYEIGKIGMEIIIDGVDSIPKNCFIDIVEDRSIVDGAGVGYAHLNKWPDDKDTSQELLVSIDGAQRHPHICLSKRKQVRLENLYRESPVIIAYKGTFNPVHNTHVALAEKAREMYKSNPVFVLSMDIYEKGHVDPEVLIKRAYHINDLGYDVIIVRSGYFSSFTDIVRAKFKDKKIVFPLGIDTFNRLLDSTHKTLEDFQKDFTNSKFLMLHRNGYELHKDAQTFVDYYDLLSDSDPADISSTEIRKLKEENKLDELKKLVPEKVFNQIKTK